MECTAGQTFDPIAEAMLSKDKSLMSDNDCSNSGRHPGQVSTN